MNDDLCCLQTHLDMASSRDGEVMIIEINNGLVYPAVEFIEHKVKNAVRHSKLILSSYW